MDDVPEETPEQAAEETPAGAPADDAPDAGTGHPAVDEVLRSLDALDDRPVEEHVAVFEQSHEALRRTLSGAGDDQG